MNARERAVIAETLSTEQGAESAGLAVAREVCEALLFDVLDNTPAAMKRVFLERFLSGMAGVLCAHLGPQGAQDALDAVKVAINDVAKERAN